jgi:uncharacterized protein (DUF2147 family)
MLRFVYALLLLLLLTATAAAAQTPTPIGIWQDATNRIMVEIAPCDSRLCGKIVWFKWPNDDLGLPLVDINNPDPALRLRPLLGLTILTNLRQTGESTWGDGRIYYPDDGEFYHARMSIQENGTLRVRIYALFPLFGETQIWTRVR